MPVLYHFPICPFSRRIRLALAEMGFEAELAEERPWDRRHDFLLMNPAGTLPVLIDSTRQVIAGRTAVTEYLEEIAAADGGHSMLPGSVHDRAEVRRLVEWFDLKFDAEVTRLLVREKVDKRYMDASQGGGGPDMEAVRAARHNIRSHLVYVGYLTENRRWLAGDELSHADLAAAAHLSCIDFLGDVPWDESPPAKDWYARIKSRPAFRSLLKDTMRGIVPPSHYEDLDF